MAASKTAWQGEVRALMKKHGCSWEEAKAIRANGGKKPRAKRGAVAYGPGPVLQDLIASTIEHTQPTAVVYLVQKAEEFVNACGGDVKRAKELLDTYQRLLPVEQTPTDEPKSAKTKATKSTQPAAESTTTEAAPKSA